MSKIFKHTTYSLATLLNYIQMGEIGLPELQRPFVWKNTKVRDLFDSLYRGYPIGNILLWENEQNNERKQIGVEEKQKFPRLLVIDGQQRLTALYAVIKGKEIVRKNFSKERIYIAFNPFEERFAVKDAAIEKNKWYISDISILWNGNTDIFGVVENYLSELKRNHHLDFEKEKKIKESIRKLYSITENYDFNVLELTPDANEEDIMEVFVRINSQGTILKQSNFIYSLISVFWEEGRKELEQFCADARINPKKGQPSPFNKFLEPQPEDLLRVITAVGFKRAKLKYAILLLRGKDLETEKFSDEKRIEQLEIFKKAQREVLNLDSWHDFFNCIRLAGFRNSNMISSKNALLFSYIFYLIGKNKYMVESSKLRQLIARWFFMSNLARRYTGSTEAQMEKDLNQLRSVENDKEFIDSLEGICEEELTEDFWQIKLPRQLATTNAPSPALYAYYAALVLLDARILFSRLKVADLLDEVGQGKRKNIERHHLFPKAYLKGIGISNFREVTQTGNLALIEWKDNAKFKDSPPSEYLPKIKSKFSDEEWRNFYYWHGLPDGWEEMKYDEFLEERHKRMANVIREGYNKL